jgi:hypothetical protein
VLTSGISLGHASIEVSACSVDLTLVTRLRRRAQALLEKLGLGREADLHPALGDAIERNDERQQEGLGRRERTAEIFLALATLSAGVALLAFAPRSQAFDPWLALALVFAFAIAYRVRFYDGAGYTGPTALVLVPMLLLLPPPTVPLLVAAAMTFGNADRFFRGAVHPERLALSLSDALHTVGPAVVLTFAAPAEPSWSAVPIYVAALGAQFGLDLLITALRDWFVVGLGADLALPLVAWTWLIDTLLSTVGLLAALAARDEPFGALLVLPVVALLASTSRSS